MLLVASVFKLAVLWRNMILYFSKAVFRPTSIGAPGRAIFLFFWTLPVDIIWTLKVSDPIIGKDADEHVIKTNPIRVGRSKEMDLQLTRKKVSNRHLILTYEDGRVYVEDLDSTNGTFIYKKGMWLRIHGKLRARPPILINVGKSLNVVVKVAEEGKGARDGSELGMDLAWINKIDPHSSFVENIQEVETFESILVLDLCHSSEMAQDDEKMAFHMKKKLKDICEWAFSQYNARFIKSTGDGYLTTFINPAAALMAAKDILAVLKQRNERTSNPPIQVRLALHIGSTYTIDDINQDIHGNDVNITFRMEGVTEDAFDSLNLELPATDRILCSKEYFTAISEEEVVSSQFTFILLGGASLKGIKDPKSIYLVTPQEGKGEQNFPPDGP
ncbi:MAG: FHA domain-containing protein [Nitrospinota bacterium]|nr:FHA domain-containing protein [Nitrospinota bacterium]MDH5755701.1 FHA domain-containing protein [Nitrospinota bacterium]